MEKLGIKAAGIFILSMFICLAMLWTTSWGEEPPKAEGSPKAKEDKKAAEAKPEDQPQFTCAVDALTQYVFRGVALAGASLDLWASWGAELSNDKLAFPIPNDRGGYSNRFYQSFHVGHLMATVNFPIGKYVKFSPKIMYWYALSGDATRVIGGPGEANPGLSWDRKHNHVLGGATLTVNF